MCPAIRCDRPSQRVTNAPKAFTLVELLVVIAIIGVLVALLLPIVPVSGSLTFEGRPRPQVCRLTFLPQKSAGTGGSLRPSGGEMQSDGSYELTPVKGIKGLYPGEYRVTIAYYDLRSGGNPDRESDWQEFTHDVEQQLAVEKSSRAVTFDIAVP